MRRSVCFRGVALRCVVSRAALRSEPFFSLRRFPTSPTHPNTHTHTTRTHTTAGSARLYEDPDVDEYDGADDPGYWRRGIPNQDEFVANCLERVTVR